MTRVRTRVGPQSLTGGRTLDVDQLLDDSHTGIIVCCGSGGVGKTTISAALALRAAERGRNVVVLTIDPARRLAQSMGIEVLDNTPRPVAGVVPTDPAGEGRLDAMMLDMKRTFDEVVESQADSVTRLFRSGQTAVHLVTVLEEMPVQETTDGIAELREHGLPVGGVVVDMVRPRDLSDDDLAVIRAGKVTKRQVATELNRGGLTGNAELVMSLLTEARDHAERRELEDEQRALVGELGVPTYELPRLVGGVDLGGLYELAGLLRDQGLT